MPISERITIPPNLTQGKTLENLRDNVQTLQALDTPQALLQLAAIDRRAPGWLSLVLVFCMRMAFVGSLGSLLVFLGLSWLSFLPRLLQLRQPEPLWGPAWNLIGIAWVILAFFSSPFSRTAFSTRGLVPEYKLPAMLNTGLSIARTGAQLVGLFFVLIGLVSVMIIVLHGSQVGTQMVISSLKEQDLPAWVSYSSSALVLLIATFLIFKGLGWLPLGLFWLFGLWDLIRQPQLGLVNLPGVYGPLPAGYLALVLSALFPLRITHFSAAQSLNLFKSGQAQVIHFVQGVKLRRSLRLAYATHEQRNQQKVANDGAHAICRQDLEYFVSRRAGPVLFWSCPVCLDDYWVYTHVHTIQGVLDGRMSAPHEQQDSKLRINLLAWRTEARMPPPLTLDELCIGRLDDEHEVEWFTTKYRLMQPRQRNWAPPQRIRLSLAPDIEIDEHTRRQAQNFFNGH